MARLFQVLFYINLSLHLFIIDFTRHLFIDNHFVRTLLRTAVVLYPTTFFRQVQTIVFVHLIIRRRNVIVCQTLFVHVGTTTIVHHHEVVVAHKERPCLIVQSVHHTLAENKLRCRYAGRPPETLGRSIRRCRQVVGIERYGGVVLVVGVCPKHGTPPHNAGIVAYKRTEFNVGIELDSCQGKS